MFDIVNIIQTVGLIGIYFIVFAESGLLFGFILPGDSLLFTAGFLASQGYINIYALTIGSFIAAILGDAAGYWFGKKVGPKIFTREDSLVFHKENLLKAHAFFTKHGGKALILARFMPIVRTFIPILAGVGSMNYKKFTIYNTVGGFLWAVGLSTGGYFLGKVIPNADHYLLPIIALIILASVAPTAIHILKDKEQRTRIWNTINQKILKRTK